MKILRGLDILKDEADLNLISLTVTNNTHLLYVRRNEWGRLNTNDITSLGRGNLLPVKITDKMTALGTAVTKNSLIFDLVRREEMLLHTIPCWWIPLLLITSCSGRGGGKGVRTGKAERHVKDKMGNTGKNCLSLSYCQADIPVVCIPASNGCLMVLISMSGNNI